MWNPKGRVGLSVISSRSSSHVSVWMSWLCPPPDPPATLGMGAAVPSLSSQHIVQMKRELLLGGPTRSRKVFFRNPLESTLCVSLVSVESQAHS